MTRLSLANVNNSRPVVVLNEFVFLLKEEKHGNTQ